MWDIAHVAVGARLSTGSFERGASPAARAASRSNLFHLIVMRSKAILFDGMRQALGPASQRLWTSAVKLNIAVRRICGFPGREIGGR